MRLSLPHSYYAADIAPYRDYRVQLLTERSLDCAALELGLPDPNAVCWTHVTVLEYISVEYRDPF